MDFLKKVKRSVYSPKYYQELLDQPLSYSIKYFLAFVFIFGVLLVVGFSLFSFPKINKTLNDAVRKAANNYPQELAVTVKSGNVSTNVSTKPNVSTKANNRNRRNTLKKPNTQQLANKMVQNQQKLLNFYKIKQIHNTLKRKRNNTNNRLTKKQSIVGQSMEPQLVY